jgi:hypothetical protein
MKKLPIRRRVKVYNFSVKAYFRVRKIWNGDYQDTVDDYTYTQTFQPSVRLEQTATYE